LGQVIEDGVKEHGFDHFFLLEPHVGTLHDEVCEDSQEFSQLLAHIFIYRLEGSLQRLISHEQLVQLGNDLFSLFEADHNRLRIELLPEDVVLQQLADCEQLVLVEEGKVGLLGRVHIEEHVEDVLVLPVPEL
jgi:hypothetical protein